MNRRCLDCGQISQKTRCPTCHTKHRAKYHGQWPALSREAIAAHPWCSLCGSTEDLTTDHVRAGSLDAGVQVLCRTCNGRKQDRLL